MSAQSLTIKRSKKDKLSMYNEDNLYKKRGLCPNRFTLLKEIFNRKRWTIAPFSSTKTRSPDDKIYNLQYLYVSESRKIFFVPNHDDPECKEEKTMYGYYLTQTRTDQDGSEMQGEKLKLYMLNKKDIMKYFPPLSEELIKQLESFHRISRNAERFIRGKWDDLIKEKEELGEYVYFLTEGFSRLNYQTTGRVYGNWE